MKTKEIQHKPRHNFQVTTLIGKGMIPILSEIANTHFSNGFALIRSLRWGRHMILMWILMQEDIDL